MLHCYLFTTNHPCGGGCCCVFFPQTCPVCGIVYSHAHACVWKFVAGCNWEVIRRAAWAPRWSRQAPGHLGWPSHSHHNGVRWSPSKPPTLQHVPSLSVHLDKKATGDTRGVWSAKKKSQRCMVVIWEFRVVFVLSSCFNTVFISNLFKQFGRTQKGFAGKVKST